MKFQHGKSTPRHPQINGKAKSTVKAMKNSSGLPGLARE